MNANIATITVEKGLDFACSRSRGNMTYSTKIVLVSTAGYEPERDEEFLRDLLKARIELFCVVGVDAEQWEDALDWICIGEDGTGEYAIITTSHPDEPLATVIEFAERYETQAQHSTHVIYR
jgi:hypothetical protein